MDLVVKGLIGALLIIAIGFFAKRSENAAAAIIVQIPIITAMGMWAAAGGGGNVAMGKLALATLLSAPLFWAFVVPIYLLREGSWNPVLVLLVAFLSWLVVAIAWYKLLADHL